MTASVITATQLSKCFRRYKSDRPRTWQELAILGLKGFSRPERFWGLRDVNFSVDRGRMLGIIGRNGAGKSTLLRIIGGLLRPDGGSIHVEGRVGGLLELGAGLHGDLTGRENIMITGIVGGLTRHEVLERMESIIDFAEIASAVDHPLRTYSTGMQMRLAFSVAIHGRSDILLVDEVLAVGDLAFQQKCINRIRRLKSEGCAVVLVSHDTASVGKMCDEALWLEKGRVRAIGVAKEVVRAYSADIIEEIKRRTPARRASGQSEAIPGSARPASMEVELTSVGVLNAAGVPATEFRCGEPLIIEIGYYAPASIHSPIFVINVSEAEGYVHFTAATDSPPRSVPVIDGVGRIVAQIENLYLPPGKYYVDAGVYERNWKYAYDNHWHAYSIELTRSADEPERATGEARARWTLAELAGPSSSAAT